MSLQFYLFYRENRHVPIPIVFQNNIISDKFSIQINGYTIAYHLDVETIPLAQLIVGNFQRSSPVCLVIIQTAGTNLCSNIDTGCIPNLHLWRTTQVNTCIRFRTCRIQHPIYVHFEITILLLRTQIIVSLAIKNQ